jgi:hypothetical protein
VPKEKEHFDELHRLVTGRVQALLNEARAKANG